LPSGTGKTTYSKRYDELMDVDELYDKASKRDRIERMKTRKTELG
jgi:hypothetical protein